MPAADLAMQRKVPTRLIRITRSKLASGKCFILPLVLSRPAVLTALPGAGAVDEHARLAVRRARLREARVDLLFQGHVDLAEDAAELGRQRLCLRCVEVEPRDLDAVAGQAPRGRATEAEAPPVTTAAMLESSCMRIPSIDLLRIRDSDFGRSRPLPLREGRGQGLSVLTVINSGTLNQVNRASAICCRPRWVSSRVIK